MARLAFLFRTDVHAADRSPSSWKGDYPAEIFSNLEQIGALAKAHKCQAVLDGGDFFHVKAANRNSHSLIVRITKIHSAYPCEVWCIEGNHDISGNNLGTIEQQPLGVLYESKVFRHLREEVFEDDELRVRVVGVPYDPDLTLDRLRAIQKQPGDTHLIAIVHALAGKNPPAHVEDFFGEPVFKYESLVTDSGPDVWCFGHWHRDQGIEEIGGKYFVNQGSVSRGALVRENLERTPKVALIECSDEVKVTPIPLSVLPATEVFDVEKKERRDREVEIIDQFVSAIGDSVEFDPTVDVEDNIQKLNHEFASDVRETALDYLTRAREKKGRH